MMGATRKNHRASRPTSLGTRPRPITSPPHAEMEAFYASFFPHSDCGNFTYHFTTTDQFETHFHKVESHAANIYNPQPGWRLSSSDAIHAPRPFPTIDAAIQALKAVAQ